MSDSNIASDLDPTGGSDKVENRSYTLFQNRVQMFTFLKPPNDLLLTKGQYLRRYKSEHVNMVSEDTPKYIFI